MIKQDLLKSIWQGLFKSKYIFALTGILVLGIPRFILVLNAQVTGKYGGVMVIFLIMWALPFAFLTTYGRKSIGMVRVQNYKWLFLSILLGASICCIGYAIAWFLYHENSQNWLVYMSGAYQLPDHALVGSSRHVYFLIYASVAMIFSPVGEELFFRGIVHESFKDGLGSTKASHLDSLAFAVTHLAHFGIVYLQGTWQFLWIPAFLWVVLMYLTSRVFFICKQKTGSLWGAVLSHAGFNGTMMYLIFYHIFK